MIEQGLLVGIHKKDIGEAAFEYSMEELKQLAESCDIEVLEQVTQKLQQPNSSTYLGKGKLDVVADKIAEIGATVVIFNDELTPSQIRNIQKKLEVNCIDRSQLILEIFAAGARTKEAKLQVDIARWKYLLPRLIGSRMYLSRQGGSSSLRNRGAGETQLELDRRKIEKRIQRSEARLTQLVKDRQVQRNRRKKLGIPVVSLIGYTNAGKSMLLNSFLTLEKGEKDSKTVLEKDQLFATLETSARALTTENKQPFIMMDTVGFVDQLPHHLIKAFRSTLEEVLEADVLVHVVDASHPQKDKMIEVTEKTIDALGAGDRPQIFAYNKSDCLDVKIPIVVREGVYLSAKESIGIIELKKMIEKELFGDTEIYDLSIPYKDSEALVLLRKKGELLKIDYKDERIEIKLRWPKKSLGELKKEWIVLHSMT